MLCFPASDSGDRHPGTGDRHRPEQVIVFAGIRTGAAFEQFGETLTQTASQITGLVTCSLIALLVNLPLWVLGNSFSALLIFAVPSIIYIICGLWMSGRLYREVTRPIPVNRFAILPPLALTIAALSTWYAYQYQNRTEKEHFVIPDGYTGLIAVGFDQEVGQPPKYEWFTRMYEIPARGVLFTKPHDRGWQVQFSYLDLTGHRVKLPYTYWCDEAQKLQEEIVVCGNLSGFFNNYDHSIEFRAYLVGPASQLKQMEEEFHKREWYKGYDANVLFPEK
jgi:hypothetical protein